MSPKFDKIKYNKNAKNNRLKKNKADSDSEEDIFNTEDEYETVSESDSTYTPPKRKSKKRVVESDTEEDDDDEESLGSQDTDDDEEDEYEDDEDHEDDEPMSNVELYKAISRIFPSKYANEKLQLQKMIEKEKSKKSEKKSGSNKKSEKSDKKSSSNKKSDKKYKYKKSKKEEEEEDEEEDDSDDEEYDPDEDDKKIDIIFTIGGGGNDYADEEEYNDADDDLDCDSEDEKMFMKETYQPVEMPKNEKNEKKKPKKLDKKIKIKEAEEKKDDITDVEEEYLDLAETKKSLTNQLHKRPKSKVLLNAIKECDKSIKKLVKKARIKNAKGYHKLINDDKKYTDEIDYFKKKLSNKEQIRVMKDLKEINSHINIDKPYRLALLQSKIPAKIKACALQKLNVLRMMEPGGDPEFYKMKNWVDTFMKIPFCINKSLSVTMDDGIESCHSFMNNAKNILDNCVYGLDDAKMQIMQMVGQWISNPSAMGTAIAIKGPPGTGKTSLIKDGISKILGREFAFIALGGAGDSSFLEGHSYTYEGSSWGKIVQILIDSKCMNPVIYFDELDKISDTPRGEEIVGILTHLTDTSQNSQFHDKYFSEIDFDLSKCLFIFSYNDESKVNPILKDRMYRIQTKGYDAKEKVIIARNYLLPKIIEQVNFKEGEVIIPDDTIQYIVTNKALTKDEAGVRNLKRCLEIVHTKLNLFRLIKPDDKLFMKDMDIQVSFPFTVTRKEVDIFIKNEETQNQSLLAMYV